MNVEPNNASTNVVVEVDNEVEMTSQGSPGTNARANCDVEMTSEQSRNGGIRELYASSSGSGATSISLKPEDEKEYEDKTKTCILNMLDEMESRVEKLRADVSKVEAEREDILSSLDALTNSQLVSNLRAIDLDEVNRYAIRLTNRAAAIHVEISTERSSSQQESLSLVNLLIDGLVREIKSDAIAAKKRCVSYLNSCSDESDTLFQQQIGIDSAFERAVLGCTLEDQKRVKKRLNGLYSYVSTFTDRSGAQHLSLSQIEEEAFQTN